MPCHAPDSYAVASLSPRKSGRAIQWQICGWKNYNGIRERFFKSTSSFPSILVNQCSILFIIKATVNSRGISEAWGPSNKVMLFCKPGSTENWDTQTLQHSCEQSIKLQHSDTWRSHGGKRYNHVILGCDTVYFGGYASMFRRRCWL